VAAGALDLITCRLGSRDLSRQRRQKREDKLAERVGYLELREVAAAGQHHAPRAPDAGLEGASVRVNIRDVVCPTPANHASVERRRRYA
jgi:hypothetical protein